MNKHINLSLIRKVIINGACTMPETKEKINSGVTLIYRYYDKDTILIGDISINKKLCKSHK